MIVLFSVRVGSLNTTPPYGIKDEPSTALTALHAAKAVGRNQVMAEPVPTTFVR